MPLVIIYSGLLYHRVEVYSVNGGYELKLFIDPKSQIFT